jgi:hypothetical protein
LPSPDFARRPPRSAAATAGFVALVAFAMLLTIAGSSELIDQVTAARNLRSGLTATVLDFGLVVVGPVLVLAYFHLMPRATLMRVLGNLRGFFLGWDKPSGGLWRR